MPILTLNKVSKRYGAVTVAEEFDLEVGGGEALGIIGPNGAGKTSLFNLIAGTVRCDAGTVHFRGRDVTRLGAAERCRLGMSRSFQIPHPFSGMTVFENVIVGAAFGGGMSERDAYRKAVEVIDLTGLSAKANAIAGSLTLLERKRLEMARALATEPRLLLLDEIAGGLTDQEALALVGLVRGVRDTGVAIVWIEHVVHALLAAADRLVVLAAGGIIAEGKPQQVIRDPEVQRVYMGIEV